MTTARDKILDLDALGDTVERLKGEGKAVAMCHGCFDILHFGHLRHFEAAREKADVLVVTVTPDRFVNKGPDRPVFEAEQRAELIAGLNMVSHVAINRWASAVEAIRRVRPTFFVKGQEYETNAANVNPNFFAEAEAVREVGGTIMFTHEETSSSTAAVKRLQRLGG